MRTELGRINRIMITSKIIFSNTLEAEINGKRQAYDACSLASYKTLKEAKLSYQNFHYIGSGNKIWINGILQSGRNKYWFFKKNKN